MSTMAPSFEMHQPTRLERDRHVAGLGSEDLPAHHCFFEPSPDRPVVMRMMGEPCAHAASGTGEAQNLATRIRLLIAREGGASALGRRCGVSEGTVRNWRDGHSDPSRARCVTLARALNISLQWLVTGEGSMHPERNERHGDDAEAAPPYVATTVMPAASPAVGIDARRLAATLRLLQSYICLVGGSLNIEQRSEVVAELYGLLCDGGELREVDRLIAFHSKLGAQLRNGRNVDLIA
ncbi:helix-turn-helix domain-containing protein [Rhodanobacter umsongensis]|uniref:Helix-turn-helix domain-containing protein n=1 Tax=Rhodanobacter umsongensis TaxID=633153 RepID=A0ABW0JKK9_9GAMM